MTVIDTCSLLNLARFYLPFDKDSALLNFIKIKVESGDLIIIDHVVKQCGWVNQGFVLDKIPFLKKFETKTADYLPDRMFFQWLNNEFKDPQECKKLSPEEFERQKESFSNDADVKMLLFCNKHKNSITPARLLTDETGKNNDSKFFKKLPTLCQTVGVECIDLPTFLKECDVIHVNVPS